MPPMTRYILGIGAGDVPVPTGCCVRPGDEDVPGSCFVLRFMRAMSVTSFRRSLLRNIVVVLLGALGVASATADTVYITGCVSNCPSGTDCQGLNTDANLNTGLFVYNDNGYSSFTSAKATAPGKPAEPGARYFSTSFSNSTPDFGITLNPSLEVPGGVYQIYHVFTSAAGNVSTNIILGVTNVAGCTLSFTNTDKFQSTYGAVTSGANVWQFLGYLTNDPGSADPIITFYFEGGDVNAGTQQRLIVDTFRFDYLVPCLAVAPVGITGPLAANLSAVAVTGVSSNATHLTVYQDIGFGFTNLVGSAEVSNVSGSVEVPVSGLIKGAQVAATQTIDAQEGCIPASGFIVGGGANPSVRIAFSIRANPDLVGPVGSTSGGTNSNIYFLGASSVLPGTCPEQGAVLIPGTNWQTVTFTRGDVNNPTDPSVIWNGSTGPTLEGNFGGLDGLAIACQGDTGPLEIYLDDLSNGTNGVVQDWESPDAGTLGYQFNQPSYSGSTAGNIMAAPNQSIVTTATSSSGAKSCLVKFQYNSEATNKWLRLVTAAAGGAQNPQLDLNEPISIKVLLLPPGVSPVSSAPGSIAITRSGSDVTLDWPGTFQLQSATDVTGPYNDVTGITTGPYTVSSGSGALFFRLRN